MIKFRVVRHCRRLLCPLWADTAKISGGKQARVWQKMIGISSSIGAVVKGLVSVNKIYSLTRRPSLYCDSRGIIGVRGLTTGGKGGAEGGVQKLSHDGRRCNVANGRLHRYDDDRHGTTLKYCLRNLCIYLVTLPTPSCL